MDIMQLHSYFLSKKGVTESFPFDEHTLVFKVLGKMFGLIGLNQWEKGQKSVNLKCNPEYAEELRAQYTAITPGYHMNKKHWNTVNLSSGEISEKFLKELIDHSYIMVINGLSKKMRDSLQ